MVTVIELVLQIVLGIALPLWIVRRDLGRLSPERLACAWTDASLWSAIVAFGPLSLPVHFAKTRRSLAGLGLGCIWTALCIAVSAGAVNALDGLNR